MGTYIPQNYVKTVFTIGNSLKSSEAGMAFIGVKRRFWRIDIRGNQSDIHRGSVPTNVYKSLSFHNEHNHIL